MEKDSEGLANTVGSAKKTVGVSDYQSLLSHTCVGIGRVHQCMAMQVLCCNYNAKTVFLNNPTETVLTGRDCPKHNKYM